MKIGSLELENKVVLAPMAGITDICFREIVKSMGTSLVCSEMISAEGLMRGGKNTKNLIKVSEYERPVSMQLFGSKPESMAESAKILNGIADIIDINCGCSVKKVLKTGSGAALLKDPDLLKKILQSVIKYSKVPVTIKIRSGWNDKQINAVEIAKLAESCGVNAIVIHPRTKAQGFSGKADWDIIKEVKSNVKIPVIGNGDIKNETDAERMLKETSCDAIMIGRASLGNPWIFKEVIYYLKNKVVLNKTGFNERLQLIKKHGEMVVKFKGETRALREFRSQLHWYFKGLRGAKEIRHRINSMLTYENFLEIMNMAEREGLCKQTI